MKEYLIDLRHFGKGWLPTYYSISTKQLSKFVRNGQYVDDAISS